jgi:TrmH RNA methyltransferase
MQYCAQQRLAYHIVEEEELEKITQSNHHEGICLLVRRPPSPSPAEWLAAEPSGGPSCVVALEDVGNPHNVGAVLRVAAHFGVAAVCERDASLLHAGSAVRTAEGGAEFVDTLVYDSIASLTKAFKTAGYSVVATSSHKGENIFKTALPERCLILFGSETAGLSREASEAATLEITIPGTGVVESLNVSTASSIVLSEFWRQHGQPGAKCAPFQRTGARRKVSAEK